MQIKLWSSSQSADSDKMCRLSGGSVKATKTVLFYKLFHVSHESLSVCLLIKAPKPVVLQVIVHKELQIFSPV